MQRKHILAIALAAATMASIAVYAQKSTLAEIDSPQARTADLPPSAAQKRLSMRASDLNKSKAAAPAALRGPASAAVTVEDVGDVESFGRQVIYLGLTSAFVTLEETCPSPSPSPDQFCQPLNPAVGGLTAFSFEDMARIKLPGKSTHSLLCYWFSPLLTTSYSNPTGSRVTGLMRYTPTLTVKNPVLDDPALVDPSTGVPFGGQLLTSMTSSEIFQVPLEPGVAFTERTRDSTVCMAGLLSKRALIENYGLTEAQATEFFKNPTTVSLNVIGSARYVDFVGLTMGLRIVGDKR
ncbi:MAG: hypothetical protein E6Q88_10660 [Lysobacteraceae bacterium]|nr:MAG: hypothetical protein E6Q88_10660 [Xanthomonadaceae bacterium]